jgi:phosphorylase kinase alpha/beta subunit
LYNTASLTPAELFTKIRNVFASQKELYSKGIGASLHQLELNGKGGFSGDRDWLAWRAERGLATHFDDDFLQSVWNSFAHASILEFGDGLSSEHTIICDDVITSMTAREVIFAQLIDSVTLHLHPVYYKSLVIEALYAYAKFCELNPESHFEITINFAKVLEAAAGAYSKDKNISRNQERDLDVFLRQTPGVVNRYLTATFTQMASTNQAA